MVHEDSRLWVTLGVVICTAAAVSCWALLIWAVGWPIAVLLLAVPMFIWLLVELRHHRR